MFGPARAHRKVIRRCGGAGRGHGPGSGAWVAAMTRPQACSALGEVDAVSCTWKGICSAVGVSGSPVHQGSPGLAAAERAILHPSSVKHPGTTAPGVPHSTVITFALRQRPGFSQARDLELSL